MSQYTFRCNRCETEATDSNRGMIQGFAEHHYNLVHALYAGEESVRRLRGPDEEESDESTAQ